VDLTGFFVDYYETAIGPDELLTEIEVPVLEAGWRGVYLKYTSRSVDDRTCLGVAAFVLPDSEGRCSGLRLCVAGAGPVPLRLPDVERRFAGETPGEDELDGLAGQYAAEADPLSDTRGTAAYRRRVMRALIPAAVRAAFEGREGALVA
jgi:carbon-monoxide dehydrogenase medium subunit